MLRRDFRFGDGKQVRLAAFAHVPADARSACIAVIEVPSDPIEAVSFCRELGAPVVFVCYGSQLQWWRQSPGEPQLVESLPATEIECFFGAHQADFAPTAVYRAKTWARFGKHYQLSFVDMGLMPLVESEIGEALGSLIERSVSTLKSRLAWRRLSEDQSDWLLRSVFWLVAAKLLRDKQVSAFSDVQLSDVDEVFVRVAAHYGTTTKVAARNAHERDALREVAATIAGFAHLGHATTESLAYVYENTLISKETRKALGTHSTPPYLVDYVVGKLASWIEEIPLRDRSVFEPACGHAAFLVSAMRLLRELLPGNWSPRRRHEYLHKRLHGCEVDAFALEIARLSLTLADVPNPDGWDLQLTDMFERDVLVRSAESATILVANAPFENFTATERASYQKHEEELRHANKTAEMLRRALPALPAGAVVGIVVPQGLLHSSNATEVREMLVREFEIADICLLPDGIFTLSDMESAIVLARKRPVRKRRGSSFTYRRVRERDLDGFKRDYRFSSVRRLGQSRFSADNGWDMRVPELDELWHWCRLYATLESVAHVSYGLSYEARNLPEGAVKYSQRRFTGAKRGFVRLKHDLLLHQLPRGLWMNLSREVVQVKRAGAATGIPQLLVNRAPVSRGPWRLKALIDAEGHAVTDAFVTIRPSETAWSLEFLWAICNSPFANAFAFTHSTKRHNLTTMMRSIPVPAVAECDIQRVTEAVRGYLQEVAQEEQMLAPPIRPDLARDLMLRVDADVLRLYDLPPRLERQLLDLFAGWQREGVPFQFERYYPEDYEPCFPLHEYLSDSYERSTAGYLRAQPREDLPPELLNALGVAVEAYADEE